MKRFILILLLLCTLKVNASWVTNGFAPSVGLKSKDINVNFNPVQTPFLATNGQIIYSVQVGAKATNGILAPTWLVGGLYTCTFGPVPDTITILCPIDTNTYSLWQLWQFAVTNVPAITNFHGIIVQVTNQDGTIKVTNSTGPIVYIGGVTGGGGGGDSSLPDDSTIVTNTANVFSASTNITHLSVATGTLTVSNGVPGTATNSQTSGTISITDHGTNVFSTSTNNGTAIGGFLTIQQYLNQGYLTFSGWFDTDSQYPGVFGRYSWSSNTADFLGKHYLGNTFYSILGDTIGGGVLTPTFGSRYQTNFAGASFSFGPPAGVENSGLTPIGWNEVGVLVSNTSGGAIVASFPSTWTNLWVTNGLTASIPAHSELLFTISVIPAFMTNVSWSSGALGGGGGVTPTFAPNLISTTAGTNIAPGASVTNINSLNATNLHNRTFIGTFFTNYEGNTGWTNISFGNTNNYANGFQNLTNATGSGQLGPSSFGFTNGTSFIFWDGTRLNVGGAYNFSPTGFTNLTAALTFYNFGANSTASISNVQAQVVTASTGFFGTFVTTNTDTNQLVWGRDTFDGAGNHTPSGGINSTNLSLDFRTNLYFYGSGSNSMCWSNFLGLLPNQVAFTRVIFYSTNLQNINQTYLSFASNNTLNITPHNWSRGNQLATYAPGTTLSLYEMDVLAFISAGNVTNVIMELKPPSQSFTVGDGTSTTHYGAWGVTNDNGNLYLDSTGAGATVHLGQTGFENMTVAYAQSKIAANGTSGQYTFGSTLFTSRDPFQYIAIGNAGETEGVFLTEMSFPGPPQFSYISSNQFNGGFTTTSPSNYMGTFAQTNTVTISTAGMLLSNAWFQVLGNGTNGLMSWKFHVQGTDKAGAEMCEMTNDAFVVFSNCPPNYAVAYFYPGGFIGNAPTLTASVSATGCAINCTDINTDPVNYTIDGTVRWTWKK